MPAEHTVNCPECNAAKLTKAAQNVRLRCESCGHPFLAPPVPDPVTTTVAPASAPPPPAPAKRSTVTVKKVSKVNVTNNSKVRKPAPKPAVDDVVTPAPPTVPAVPAHQERSKIAGRRGGLGFYNSRVRHRAS